MGLQVDELDRQQAQQEADVAQVVARRDRDQTRLDAGQVGSPRDLQNLQSEIEALERRKRVLEDAELEVMEHLEAAEARQRELTTQLAEVAARGEAARASRDDQWATLDAEAAGLRAERDAVAGGLPADLLAAYEGLRTQLGGVAAAPLRQGRCEGCRLQVDPADLRRFTAAPADEVLRCGECRRILVPAGEPGP